MFTIQFKRCLKDDLPESAAEGEPIFCMTDDTLYIGRGEGKPLAGPYVQYKSKWILFKDYIKKLFKKNNTT